jgi:hypothetical protein
MNMDWNIGINGVTFTAAQVYAILSGACVLFLLLLVAAGIAFAMMTRRHREE